MTATRSADLDAAPLTAEQPGVLDTFETRMHRIWARDGISVPDPDGLARLLRLLLEQQGPASPAAAQVLEDSGVRRQWNGVFSRRRAGQVAAWLDPHVGGHMLDVLAGDFTLTRELHAGGRRSVVAVERGGSYQTDWSAQPFPVLDYAELDRVGQERFDTAVISAVLHHEPDPVGLLDRLDMLHCRRWVVVENCLDVDNSEAFHLFVDRFFNECLNRFDVPCVSQHRTHSQWRTLLGRYGEVTVAESRRDVPGIPFPYDLFVVARP